MFLRAKYLSHVQLFEIRQTLQLVSWFASDFMTIKIKTIYGVSLSAGENVLKNGSLFGVLAHFTMHFAALFEFFVLVWLKHVSQNMTYYVNTPLSICCVHAWAADSIERKAINKLPPSLLRKQLWRSTLLYFVVSCWLYQENVAIT